MAWSGREGIPRFEQRRAFARRAWSSGKNLFVVKVASTASALPRLNFVVLSVTAGRGITTILRTHASAVYASWECAQRHCQTALRRGRCLARMAHDNSPAAALHIDPPDRLTLRHLTVYDLTLRPGPSLVFGFPETRQNNTTRATANVTADASRFLFHAIRVEPGVALKDILLLLDACPALVDTFRLRFAEQVRDEVLKGPLTQASDSGRTSQVLDHLELRWAWGLDTDTLEYSSVHALELSGMGPVVQADDARQGLKAGDRERWSLKLTPVRELLHLPVIVSYDFAITETDHDSRKFGEPVANGRLAEVTLGQLIHGLLSELTFHGGPTEQAAFSEELVQQLSRLESGDEETVDAESVFNELMPEDAGFSAMFESLGDVTQSDVRRVMYSIEDD